jgi:hypothetical protein
MAVRNGANAADEDYGHEWSDRTQLAALEVLRITAA